jgi:nickel-type superoxide dismutase maturation protease
MTVATTDRRRASRGLLLLGLGALGAAGLLGLARVEVEGESMQPTLAPGDRLLLRRRRPGGHLAPGTIVALPDPRSGESRLMLKRVAAVAGDLVTLLGDNPAASTDSRTFGEVDRRRIPWVVLRRYRRTEGSALGR